MEKNIPLLIKVERTKLEMLQREFADYCDVHHQTIVNIETGKKVRSSTLSKVLDKIGYELVTITGAVKKK